LNFESGLKSIAVAEQKQLVVFGFR